MSVRPILSYAKYCCRFVHTIPPGHHQHKLKTAQTHLGKTPDEKHEPSRIRNIGIIAHIDAGKTTTTERLLYFAGSTTFIGDVDTGDTVTDFMDQEQERGITIQSAAVTFYWDHNRINLIDTPGHVDFTVEVERCLRVLDGAVTILDASAGIQAQTMTVWRQTEKFALPSVIYLNKMDKPAASVSMCLESIERKLRIPPLLLYLPIYDRNSLIGLIDIVHMNTLKWPLKKSDGLIFEREKLQSSNGKLYENAMEHREQIVGQLTEIDDCFADRVLEIDSLDKLNANQDITPAIRRATLDRKTVPVSCGSSLRNRGVQSILDLVIDYLPSPLDRPHAFTQFYNNSLCALAFKISHDKRHGPLTFVRVYSGELKPNITCFNATRNTSETVTKLFLPHSDELQNSSVVRPGNIGVIPGLQFTVTGDTLVESEPVALKAAHAHAKAHGTKTDIENHEELIDQNMSGADRLLLTGIEPPDPVYFCSVEPPNPGAFIRFEKALKQLAIEDPSVRINLDHETQQTILSAMGELHMEIIKDRLCREWDLDIFVGPLQVSYRESITKKAQATHTLEQLINGQQQFVTVTLSVTPAPGVGKLRKVELGNPELLIGVRREKLKALREGCINACQNGPLLGYPVLDVNVRVEAYEGSRGASAALISASANESLKRALLSAGSHLLEPVMHIEVLIDGDDVESGIQKVLTDLNKRRAHIKEIVGSFSDIQNYFDNSKRIVAEAPLSELSGLAKSVRQYTSGMGHLHMELKGYRTMTENDQQQLINKQ